MTRHTRHVVRDDVVEIVWVFKYLAARWRGHRGARRARQMRELQEVMNFNGAHALHEAASP